MKKFKNINTEIGMSFMGDNEELYTKIMNMFYNNYKNIALENLDDGDLKRTVHSIKSQSATIGATQLSKVALELEETLNRELFSQFYEELKKVIDELKDLDS